MKTKLLLLALTLGILNSISVSCDQLKNEIKENTRKYCYGDLCNKTYQYCSETYQRCHLCTDMLGYCSTSELPPNCMNTCIEFFVNQKLEAEKGKTCTSMKDLKNGFQNASAEQTIKPGTVVVFSCNTGYRLVGEKIVTCNSYGHWSGSLPRCEEIICQAPPPIADGFWSNKGAYVTYSFGNTVTAFCDNSFNMDGVYIWNCSTDGWITTGLSGTFPRCSKQDGSSDFSFVNIVLIGLLAFLLVVTNIYSHRKKIKKCFLGTNTDRLKARRKIITKQNKPLLTISDDIDEAYGSKDSKLSKHSFEKNIKPENNSSEPLETPSFPQKRFHNSDGVTIVNNVTVQNGYTALSANQYNLPRTDTCMHSHFGDSQIDIPQLKAIEEKLSTEETDRSMTPERETLLPKPSASGDIRDSTKRPSVQPIYSGCVQQQDADEQGAAYKLAFDSADIHSDDITVSYV